jgi:aspartyl-tRNA(Asn)/glutamyl-tRNA(Gln) amidotransferase subunit A
MNVRKLTLCELKDKFMKGEVSAVEIVKAYFQRVLLVEPKVKAYITTAKKDALVKEADELDFTLSKWRRTMPLMAMPIAVKDNICTQGVKTTCGSRMLENFVPPYDATVVARMKEHGYYLIGKTNMDEFAMGSSTETSAFGPTRNPCNLAAIPGGSSGGSAAAVAAGLKPTYGRVSRYGLVAFASSLDQIGPITKDVRDAAVMMQVIAGHDPLDSTSADVPVPDYMKALKENLRGMKVGVPLEFFAEGLDPEVELAVRTAIIQMQTLKAEIKEISLPMTKYAIAAYYLIATAEASSNLARYDGVKYGYRAKEKGLLEMYMKTRQEGFGAEVKRRIMLGTYALSAGYYDAYYGKAQAVRTLIKRDFDEAFKEVDVIVTPTMPTPAFKLGEKIQDPLQMYLSDIYTISVNLAGLPAISLPCGLSRRKLPIGLQIIGRPFEEEKVLRAAYAYEQATEWHLKRPGL